MVEFGLSARQVVVEGCRLHGEDFYSGQWHQEILSFMGEGKMSGLINHENRSQETIARVKTQAAKRSAGFRNWTFSRTFRIVFSG
jgi:hypothetical protein